MARPVKRKFTSRVGTQLLQYLVINTDISALNKRKTLLRDEMSAIIDLSHEVDEEKGHLTHLLPEPVTVGKYTYVGVQKQRRVAQIFDEDKALKLLKDREIPEDQYMTPILDQDKVARLYADDVITDEEFEGFFEENETFAFVAVKE